MFDEHADTGPVATVDFRDRLDASHAAAPTRHEHDPSMLAATCVRTAASGSPESARSTRVSSRASASAAPLAWIVDIEPSLPRVQRLQHVERLAAAHLADDQAIGRNPQRRPHELPDGDPAAPLGVGGRASSRTTCGWASRNSAVSSMVTTRSRAGSPATRC